MQNTFIVLRILSIIIISRPISRVMSWIIIYLGLLLPTASSDLPESKPGKLITFFLVLLRMGFTCAPVVTNKAVVSYTALPPLLLRKTKQRYISVALALESPPPDVIRHPALWSPDFPHLITQPRLSSLLTFCIIHNFTRGSNFHRRIPWQESCSEYCLPE